MTAIAVGLPATLYLNRSGDLVGSHVGGISREALVEQIEKLATPASGER
jgi:hypothetical protein